MRWYVILVGVTVVVLADPAPAKAQIIPGGIPAFSAPSPVPFAPFPGVLSPGSSGVIPFANGGPVEFALNRALLSMASQGYGPYAGYNNLLAGPRFLNGAYPAYSGPWGTYPPLNVPANSGKWAQPWSGNPGLHKGWFKGGGKGGGKGKGR